jgi:hypothetical protein
MRLPETGFHFSDFLTQKQHLMRNHCILSAIAFLYCCAPVRAQSLTGGFMAGKERGAVALS